jgi:enoyl-CoA hydratase/carnithine racemase
MTQTEDVLYEVRDGVARVTINRPGVHNSMSWQVMEDLCATFARAATDDDVRVVVLTGAGEKAFCTGADLSGILGGDVAQLHDGIGAMPDLIQQMWRLGKPTIARVMGYCLAGGFGLALSCDFVVAATDAVFGAPEIDRGMWPYVISVPLRNSMPDKTALELLMTGRRVTAVEGKQIGFVTELVAAAEIDTAVDRLAATLCRKPPTAMRLGRTSFYDTLGRSATDAFPLLQSLLAVTASSAEAEEGIRAFAERRPPNWQR